MKMFILAHPYLARGLGGRDSLRILSHHPIQGPGFHPDGKD